MKKPPDMKIELQNPSELRPSTPLGAEMASLARFASNGFAPEPIGGKVKPVQALHKVFAEGTTTKINTGKDILNFFRGASVGALTLTPLAVAVFPWTIPLIALGAATLAVSEKLRHTYKKAFKTVEDQVPRAKETVEKMTDLLDRATQQHQQEQSKQSRDQLEEVTQGFCSLFSEEIGYRPIVFNGHEFSYPESSFDGSKMIEKVNKSLKGSLSTLDKPDAPTSRGIDSPSTPGLGRNLDPKDTPNISRPGAEPNPPGVNPPSRGFDSR